jgi:DNA polymerase/3'-5' exonuclease PolX
VHAYAHKAYTSVRLLHAVAHCTLRTTALYALQSPIKRIGEGFTSEEQVFQFLGLEYIPPEYRNC